MKSIKLITVALATLGVSAALTACNNSNTVTIYTSTEDYNMEFMQKCLDEKFPDYNIKIEYLGTSDIAAKVIAEGSSSDVDIVYAEEYGYMEKMIEAGVLDSIKGDYDLSRYLDDTIPSATKDYVLPAIRTGGGVIINKKVLEDNNLSKPTSYSDLLDSKYKGLISMASPASSGTGYMFFYSLVKALGETEAIEFFDNFTPNVLAYEKSGSGPVNKLVSREVAVGFGMISQAVNKINDGNTELEVLFFNEGAPFNLYGNGIVKGKKSRKAVKDVMDYLDSYYTNESNKLYYPEPVLKGVNYNIPNFPENIVYSDMTGNNLTKKTELLAKWDAMLEKHK